MRKCNACAPRYVYHQHHPRKVERIEPVGTCFIAKDNFREYQEYSPCRTYANPCFVDFDVYSLQSATNVLIPLTPF
ncbi:CLUMA_CG014990, isoform A [Clunio marinus]|uniref:CLUMA_CG014990, isoform A n=1 Tax=Clunio marinus TaxID=568069 RepID=A0A1J1IRR1_9DIPT|nr:CLUMA_CG014990, isoform A [Clunio marinus]